MSTIVGIPLPTTFERTIGFVKLRVTALSVEDAVDADVPFVAPVELVIGDTIDPLDADDPPPENIGVETADGADTDEGDETVGVART